MDDSIYRDFYWAAGHIRIWWVWTQPIITSQTAQHLYVLSVAFTVLGISIWYASILAAELRGIAVAAFTYNRRGRKGVKQDAIDRARNELDRFRKDMWGKYRNLFISFISCGFLIPSIGLYIGAAFYGWFDPHSSAFVSADKTQFVEAPNNFQLMGFVLDQLLRGALQDFYEVFDVSPIGIVNDPHNYPFSTIIFIYRFFVGTFATALMFTIWQSILIAWRMPPVDEVIPSYQRAA